MKYVFAASAVLLFFVAMPTTLMSFASRENAVIMVEFFGRTLAEVALLSTVACVACGLAAHACEAPNKRRRLLEEIDMRYGADWHRNERRVERAISFALGGVHGIVEALAPDERIFGDSKTVAIEWSINQVLQRIGLSPLKKDSPLLRAQIHKSRIDHGVKWDVKTFRVSDTAMERFQDAVERQRPRDPRIPKPTDQATARSPAPSGE